MNFITPKSTDLLLSEAETENLYLKLIEQINKDFNLANENHKRASYCLLQMANIEHSESDYIHSEISATRAIALFDEHTSVAYQTNALNVLGQNYTQLSNFEDAPAGNYIVIVKYQLKNSDEKTETKKLKLIR